MPGKRASMQQLKAAAAKAAARAAGAKEKVRSAKAMLKEARKSFKAEKKAAKQARRKVEGAAVTLAQERASEAPSRKAPRKIAAAAAEALPSPAKTRTVRPKAPKPTEPLRSAADVAKSVIERLHNPPPALAPSAVIPSAPSVPREPPLQESAPPQSPLLDAGRSV